jgi:enoyl-CoA hydratase
MIESERRGGIALLRLAHGKASALDLELLDALDASLAEVEASDAGALVVTGTGSIFSAGVDLFRVLEGKRNYLEKFLPALDRALLRLFTFEKPVVAAINGHAIAGGAIIALACDRRILARGTATFGIPELRVGVAFPPLPLEIVRCALAPRDAQAALLGGKNWSPDECLAHGAVDELCEPSELLDRAFAVARDLASIPTRSFALTKRFSRLHALDTLERHAAAAAPRVLDAWSSPEVLDAIRAYVEKTIKK